MTCYEYSKDVKAIGKFYIISSVLGIPLTLYFLSSSNLFFVVVAKYILLGMFIFLALFGLIYIFVKGSWYFKVDNSYFEYVTPFGKSKSFKVPIDEIEKLEIQQSKSVDSVYYYLHLENKQKYQLDSESPASMTKISNCLKEASIKIEYTTGS